MQIIACHVRRGRVIWPLVVIGEGPVTMRFVTPVVIARDRGRVNVVVQHDAFTRAGGGDGTH